MCASPAQNTIALALSHSVPRVRRAQSSYTRIRRRRSWTGSQRPRMERTSCCSLSVRSRSRRLYSDGSAGIQVGRYNNVLSTLGRHTTVASCVNLRDTRRLPISPVWHWKKWWSLSQCKGAMMRRCCYVALKLELTDTSSRKYKSSRHYTHNCHSFRAAGRFVQWTPCVVERSLSRNHTSANSNSPSVSLKIALRLSSEHFVAKSGESPKFKLDLAMP